MASKSKPDRDDGDEEDRSTVSIARTVVASLLSSISLAAIPFIAYLTERKAPDWTVATAVVAALFAFAVAMALDRRLRWIISSLLLRMSSLFPVLKLAVEEPRRALRLAVEEPGSAERLAIPHGSPRTTDGAPEGTSPAVFVRAGRLVSDKHLDTLGADPAYVAFETVHADVRERLDDAIVKLGGRINQNLFIGSTFALAGIVALVVFVITAAPMQIWSQILGYFAPRLTTVAFVEMLSYFFLRLYRAGLADMKFYQNELTTIELRFAAGLLGIASKEPILVRQCVARLLVEERNGVAAPGDANGDLRRLTIEAQETPGLTGALEKVLQAFLVATQQGGGKPPVQPLAPKAHEDPPKDRIPTHQPRAQVDASADRKT